MILELLFTERYLHMLGSTINLSIIFRAFHATEKSWTLPEIFTYIIYGIQH